MEGLKKISSPYKDGNGEWVFTILNICLPPALGFVVGKITSNQKKIFL